MRVQVKADYEKFFPDERTHQSLTPLVEYFVIGIDLARPPRP